MNNSNPSRAADWSGKTAKAMRFTYHVVGLFIASRDGWVGWFP